MRQEVQLFRNILLILLEVMIKMDKLIYVEDLVNFMP